MPWMVIQGGKKPREFNEHTKTKTDLKKPKQTKQPCKKPNRKKIGKKWQALVYAWAVVPFRKTYQHLSEWKEISANIHPYGVKGMEKK